MRWPATAQWALLISILSAGGTVGNAYLTHHKFVEATLAIVGYAVTAKEGSSTTFAFHVVINNNGTQPVTVLTAEAFAIGNPGYPRKRMASASEPLADFSKPFIVEPGRQVPIDAYAHFDKAFMEDSLRTGFNSNDPRLVADARTNIQIDVVVYAADGTYRIAQSVPFGVLARRAVISGASGVSVPVKFQRMPDKEVTTIFKSSSLN